MDRVFGSDNPAARSQACLRPVSKLGRRPPHRACSMSSKGTGTSPVSVHPNQILRLKKQLLDQATRGFENGKGDGANDREREIERLHAEIGQLIVKRDFLAERSGR